MNNTKKYHQIQSQHYHHQLHNPTNLKQIHPKQSQNNKPVTINNISIKLFLLSIIYNKLCSHINH